MKRKNKKNLTTLRLSITMIIVAENKEIKILGGKYKVFISRPSTNKIVFDRGEPTWGPVGSNDTAVFFC